MILFNHIDNAFHSLGRSRARTILTTLGIAIGVGSVVAVMALSGGLTHVIDRQVEELGDNLAIIRPGNQNKDPNSLASPITQYTFSTSTLNEADLESILELPGMDSAAPIMTIDGTLRNGENLVKDSVVVATTPAFLDTTQLRIRDGQFLDETTDDNTAVIGAQLAIDLYGTDRPIGQTFSLRGQTFTVIGILRKTSSPINYNNVDFDRAVIVDLANGRNFHEGRTQIQQINFRASSFEELEPLKDAVAAQLTRNHLGETDFTIVSGEEIGQPTNQLFQAMTTVMTVIAGISLFVGGIGIMNIMLVGVAERTREIGIRKAVGASNGSIVGQFLVESLMISLLGGLLGYIIGYLAAFIICTFLFFAPLMSWEIAAVALAMSVGVGVIFGLYPAIRAARKNTIESLRQYH